MITQRSAQIAIHVLQGYSYSQVGRVFGVSPQWASDCACHCCRKVAYDVWEKAQYVKGSQLAFLRKHRFTLIGLIKHNLEQYGGV